MAPHWLLLSLMLGSFLLSSCTNKKATPPAPLPPELPVYEAISDSFSVYENFVGQTYGASDINIRARVEGFLNSIHFQEGSEVRKGQLLYSIDPQPFEAQVAESQSRVAEAKTLLVRSQSDLKRIEPLAKINAVSQSDLDAAKAAEGAAQAAYDAAQAQLRLTNIQKGYTNIYSPITGIIGKTEARVGDFVGRGADAVILNTVSQLDPILVRFAISEADYLQFRRNAVKLKEGNMPNPEEQDLDLILADGTVYPEIGHIDFADREIDPTTGTLLLQASFPNPDNFIRPGQFARVRVKTDILPDAVLVPQRSVSELQGIFQVFVVNDSNLVKVRPVEAGPKDGNMWVLTGGLKPGEHILLEGLQQVQPGQAIRPVMTPFEHIH